jgi:hypothetical protein
VCGGGALRAFEGQDNENSIPVWRARERRSSTSMLVCLLILPLVFPHCSVVRVSVELIVLLFDVLLLIFECRGVCHGEGGGGHEDVGDEAF